MGTTAKQLEQRVQRVHSAPRFDRAALAEWEAITQEQDTEVSLERLAFESLSRKLDQDLPDLVSGPEEETKDEAAQVIATGESEAVEVDLTSLSGEALLEFDFSERIARINAGLLSLGISDNLAQAS
ncbi:MAG TPA: hypothetical protein VLE74_02070 [Candidatus Saccharimonadales bacterium]|nr:hypothetical protein [Candidatus Saccharimonadales bacterium]